jgi:Ulp1 protease family, C-terminal catalytic domain
MEQPLPVYTAINNLLNPAPVFPPVLLDKIVEKQQTIRNQVDAVLRTNGYVIEKFNWVECVMPVQENGSDCGVYVLKYLEDFLDNESELLDAWVKKKDMRKRYKEFSCYDYRNHIKSILG